MITAFVIIMLFGGSFGATSLDLSDPALLAQFRQEISGIIADPVRAAAVSDALFELNELSKKSRSADGAVEQKIQNIRTVVGNYESTRAEVEAALAELDIAVKEGNRHTIVGREVVRRNTTEKEWKSLLKQLSK